MKPHRAPRASPDSEIDTIRRRLVSLERRVIACTLCPRLVEHRRAVAEAPPRRFAGETYWARPLPSFGDPGARLFVVGLAPAAHGGNRTGRMFTGDSSGDWLFRALHRHGFANQAESRRRGDGLTLRDCFITAAARCAPPDNRPTPEELRRCRPYLGTEIMAMPEVRIVVALGQIAFKSYLAARLDLGLALGEVLPRPAPRFAHGARVEFTAGQTLIASYHPSRQNTQTGRLTEAMFDGIFAAARGALGGGGAP